MLKVEEEVKVVLKDDNGAEIKEGDTVIYSPKDGVDNIATFVSYKNGLMALKKFTDGAPYNVRAKFVEKIVKADLWKKSDLAALNLEETVDRE